MLKKNFIYFSCYFLLFLTACSGDKKVAKEQEQESKVLSIQEVLDETEVKVNDQDSKENEDLAEEIQEEVNSDISLPVDFEGDQDLVDPSNESSKEEYFFDGEQSKDLGNLENVLKLLKTLPNSYLSSLLEEGKENYFLKIYGRFSDFYHKDLEVSGFYAAYDIRDGDALRLILSGKEFLVLQKIYALLPQEGVSFYIRSAAGSFTLKIAISSENKVLLQNFVFSLER